MFSGKRRRTLTHVLMALAIVVLAVPAFAQTGRIQGKVTDEAGKPVDGAKITVSTIPDTGGQKWEATSDKNGNYIIGTLPKSGNYLVHAEKSGAGVDEARAAVRLGNFTALNFSLSNKARVSEEQASKNAAIKKFFDEGVAAANHLAHESNCLSIGLTAAHRQRPEDADERARERRVVRLLFRDVIDRARTSDSDRPGVEPREVVEAQDDRPVPRDPFDTVRPQRGGGMDEDGERRAPDEPRGLHAVHVDAG